MTHTMTKQILLRNFVGAVCAGSAVLLAGCGQGAAPAAAASPTLTARVMSVAPQSVPIVIEAVGQTEGSKEVEVRARVAGIVRKQLYKEGDVVAAGTPLFQIDPEPYQIALQQARAQGGQDLARTEQARREADRLKDLVAKRAISQKEFEDAQSTAKVAVASEGASASHVREAELNLSYTNVTAPVSGVTGRAAKSEGSLISAGPDSLLTTISQVDPMWARFSLAESDLAKLPGGRLTRSSNPEIRLVFADGSVYPVKGRLNFTATQIDPRLATQQLRAEFANPKGDLLPGQFVRVQLIAGNRDNVFLVPQVAVTQTETGYLLFVLDKENKAVLRPVKVGDWIGKDWIILDGLAKGDRVVIDNLLKMRPGTVVTAAAAAPDAAKADAAKPGAASGKPADTQSAK